MVSAEQFEKAVELINGSHDIVITSHTRPDGDACGSVAAMCRGLEKLGKQVHPILLSPMPAWYESVFDQKVPILGNDITVDQLKNNYYKDCDLIIIVDTNSWVQLPQFDQWMRHCNIPVLVLDHHITRDGVGTVEVVDTKAAAAGQIVFDLFRYAKWPVDAKIAHSLFVSLSTDTGWFRFSNTDSRVYRDAADLIDAGAKPPRVYQELFQNFSVPRMKLMTSMLNTMELHFDNQCALQHILWDDFERAGATGRDTENLIDECRRISSVEVAVLFVELKDEGGFRCSLRSKDRIDVQKIAVKHGGGGHRAAAGVSLKGSLAEVKALILAELAEQFGAV